DDELGQMITRRSLLVGLGSGIIAAPAIVRASSLMPVHSIPPLLGVNGYLHQEDAWHVATRWWGKEWDIYDANVSIDWHKVYSGNYTPISTRPPALEFK